jgi:RHS repeat-associated protein
MLWLSGCFELLYVAAPRDEWLLGRPVFRAADPLKVPIDPNGNLTSKTEGTDNWVYTWNAENQLTKVEKNGSEVARFAYDPVDRRVEKAVGGVTTAYAYDDDSIVRETRGSTVLRYIQGTGADEPLAVDDGAGLSYFHGDGLGSVVKTTSAAGTVTQSRQYDAWGTLEIGSTLAGYAFTGREWDPETGLYYYRARYYDPTVGRFSSEDPAGVGNASLFSYVGNHPVNYRDPSGMYRCVYYIAEHYLQCWPDDPLNPPYATPTASSGTNGPKCGDCQNNPDRTSVRGQGTDGAGPAAAGFYRIEEPHFSRRKWRRNLTPDQRGRTDIQIHPCLNPSAPGCSIGCIALPYSEFDRLNVLLKAEKGRNTMEIYNSGTYSGPPPESGRSPSSRR